MTTTLQAAIPVQGGRPGSRPIRKFRPDIEGLRAVAVILVVVSHLGLGLPGGYVGVDVFFVISGFLITRQLMTELTSTDRISLRTFYARRARRILPAATVVIVGTLLASWKWDSPLHTRTSTVDGIYSAVSAINWRLATQGTDYFQSSLPPSPFQHYWSLAVEEQFYAVWPVLLLVISLIAARRFGRLRSIMWSLVLVIAVSLGLSVATTGSSASWAYFGTQTRAWELAIGALIGGSVSVWTRMPPALACQMTWLGLGAILVAATVFGSSTAYPGIAVLLPVMGAALLIAGGCPGWTRSAELLLKRSPMQYVGAISYSWYLVHWPILTLLPLALGHDLKLVDKLTVLGGSLLLAALMFVFVEQPIRQRTGLVRRPAQALVLGAGMVTVSITTAAIVLAGNALPAGAGSVPLAAPPTRLTTLQNEIVAAAALTSLPSNLVPSLADAGRDHPNTNCLADAPATNPPPDSTCTFGDPTGSRTIAMVGDSHANAWFPAVNAFAKAYHWRFVLYAKAACSPGIYPTYIDPATNRIYTACNTWRSAMFARIKALRPDVVVIASELRTVDIDPSGMVQAIHEFQSAAHSVIYLEDTPSPGNVGSVPDCLSKHPRDIQECALPRQSSYTRLEGMVQRTLEASAARQAGATLLDPTPWFCTATVCPPVIAGRLVYSDDSHTTATYVTWLSALMTQALERITSS